jgi:peptidoglycan-N-acetylglucosamine deacetylase
VPSRRRSFRSPAQTSYLPARVAARRARARRRMHLERLAGAALAVVVLGGVLLTLGHGSRRPPSGTIHAVRQPGAGAAKSPGAPSPGASSRELRAVQGALAYTSYIRLGTPRRREVALTFDDGPSQYTLALLRVLRRARAPATFFELGDAVRQRPAVTRLQAREGFAIGDHTRDHPAMSGVPAASQREEIASTARAIQAAGAPYPRLFRPPFGSFDATTLTELRRAGMLMVLWTVDTKDFGQPGTRRIIYTAVSGARPGAIILMHDGGGPRRQTIAALPRIILRLRQRGYRLVTVPQLVADDPPPRHQPAPLPLSGRS